MKKLVAFLCMLICILSMTGCSKTETTDYTANYDQEALKDTTEQFFSMLQNEDDTTIQNFLAMDNSQISSDNDLALEIKAGFQAWLDNRDELGDFDPQESDVCTLTADEDGAVLVLESTFTNRTGRITANYGTDGTLISFNVEPVYSMAENLENALLNTVLGMGIVFIVLIFIAFIISLFRFINKAESRVAAGHKEESHPVQKEVPRPAPAPAPVPAPAAVSEPMDDLELVAVITAAVAASMNTSVDKLVVRSIKRRSTNKWHKA